MEQRSHSGGEEAVEQATASSQSERQTGQETQSPAQPKALLAGNGLTTPNPHYTGSSTREGPLTRPILGCCGEGLKARSVSWAFPDT